MCVRVCVRVSLRVCVCTRRKNASIHFCSCVDSMNPTKLNIKVKNTLGNVRLTCKGVVQIVVLNLNKINNIIIIIKDISAFLDKFNTEHNAERRE